VVNALRFPGLAPRRLCPACTPVPAESPPLPPAQAEDVSREGGGATRPGPSSRACQALRDIAAAVARDEARFASYSAAGAVPEGSLEELRLRTPALAPVGCWSTGCAPRPPPVPPARAH
jgi:hypothetical protein